MAINTKKSKPVGKRDRRKDKIKHLRNSTKDKINQRCAQCIYFKNEIYPGAHRVVFNGRCLKHNVKVKNDEVCDNFSSYPIFYKALIFVTANSLAAFLWTFIQI